MWKADNICDNENEKHNATMVSLIYQEHVYEFLQKKLDIGVYGSGQRSEHNGSKIMRKWTYEQGTNEKEKQRRTKSDFDLLWQPVIWVCTCTALVLHPLSSYSCSMVHWRKSCSRGLATSATTALVAMQDSMLDSVESTKLMEDGVSMFPLYVGEKQGLEKVSDVKTMQVKSKQ